MLILNQNNHTLSALLYKSYDLFQLTKVVSFYLHCIFALYIFLSFLVKVDFIDRQNDLCRFLFLITSVQLFKRKTDTQLFEVLQRGYCECLVLLTLSF